MYDLCFMKASHKIHSEQEVLSGTVSTGEECEVWKDLMWKDLMIGGEGINNKEGGR